MKNSNNIKDYSHVDLLFPSKYVKASDLRGKAVTVVIDRIVPRELLVMAGNKKDNKPVIYLRGKEKGWILNKTNARDIAKAWGPEVLAWIGKPVVIVPRQVEARGEVVDAIRIDLAATMKLARGHSPRAPEPEPQYDEGETWASIMNVQSENEAEEAKPQGKSGVAPKTLGDVVTAEKEKAEVQANVRRTDAVPFPEEDEWGNPIKTRVRR